MKTSQEAASAAKLKADKEQLKINLQNFNRAHRKAAQAQERLK